MTLLRPRRPSHPGRSSLSRRLRCGPRLAVVAATLVTSLGAGIPAASAAWRHGFDISWPQCGSSALSVPSSPVGFVVLGLTDGRSHTRNPCLARQLGWARSTKAAVAAYTMASYPTPDQLTAAGRGHYGTCGANLACRLRNDGWVQGTGAAATLRAARLRVPRVWLDVEILHRQPWSTSTAANAVLLHGIVAGLRGSGLAYGVYTTPYMWHLIAGGLRLTGPNWLPAGDGVPTDAQAQCRRSATGGPTWLVQYTRTFDENLTCPALDGMSWHRDLLFGYRWGVLEVGAVGHPVMELQRRLGVTPDGIFGPITRGAVVRVQLAHRLRADGVVDTPVWRALGAYRSVGTPLADTVFGH